MRHEADPSALWGLLPSQLEALDVPGSAPHIFGMIQRPWTWNDGGPAYGKGTRDRLRAGGIEGFLPSIDARQTSSDGSTKILLRLHDGERIEVVHMPRAVLHPRVTLCISSQVGCAIDCKFCATGKMGLVRNLTSGEIVSQVLRVMRELGPTTPRELTLVFMGMGEPLQNLEHVVQSIRVFCHPAGLGLSPRRVTVSTSGLVGAIRRLARTEIRPMLAVSLNATTDEARSQIMPINDVWPLAELRSALGEWPSRSREKVTIEYVLLADTNDTDADAHRLASWVGDLRHNINLIPYNPHPRAPFRPPDEARIQSFAKILQDRGCLVTVRRSRGADIQGACGQLIQPFFSENTWFKTIRS